MKAKNWLFKIATFSSILAHFGLALLRIFMGLTLALAHGVYKLPPTEKFVVSLGMLGFPLPALFAWLSACTEFFGGLLLSIGLITRLAALLITINISVAAFMRHADDPFSVKEKALLYLFIAVLFIFTGSGKYGVDALFGGKNKT